MPKFAAIKTAKGHHLVALVSDVGLYMATIRLRRTGREARVLAASLNATLRADDQLRATEEDTAVKEKHGKSVK